MGAGVAAAVDDRVPAAGRRRVPAEQRLLFPGQAAAHVTLVVEDAAKHHSQDEEGAANGHASVGHNAGGFDGEADLQMKKKGELKGVVRALKRLRCEQTIL